jgi:hypothetical protein
VNARAEPYSVATLVHKSYVLGCLPYAKPQTPKSVTKAIKPRAEPSDAILAF